ncbi:hypothetical protein AAG906_014679 [Vitis piasezkii]
MLIRRRTRWRWQPRLNRPVVVRMRMHRRDPSAENVEARIRKRAAFIGGITMMRLAPPLALLATRSWKTS